MQPNEQQIGWDPGMLWAGSVPSSDLVASLRPDSAAFYHQPSACRETVVKKALDKNLICHQEQTRRVHRPTLGPVSIPWQK